MLGEPCCPKQLLGEPNSSLTVIFNWNWCKIVQKSLPGTLATLKDQDYPVVFCWYSMDYLPHTDYFLWYIQPSTGYKTGLTYRALENTNVRLCPNAAFVMFKVRLYTFNVNVFQNFYFPNRVSFFSVLHRHNKSKQLRAWLKESCRPLSQGVCGKPRIKWSPGFVVFI